MNILLIVAVSFICLSVVFLLWCIKRKTNRGGNELTVLREIVKALPGKYANIAKQADADLWQESIPAGGKPGLHALIVQFDDTGEECSFYDKTFPHYMVIRRIRAKSRKTGGPAEIELHLNRGVLIQYRCTIPLNELDISTVDYSDLEEQILHEKAPESEDAKKITKLFHGVSPELLAQLEIDDMFEIELDNRIFHTIKQYDSGNFLAVDRKGAVFLLCHDPYMVKELYSSVSDFLTAWKHGSINVAAEEFL